jgi:hypothetical protein
MSPTEAVAGELRFIAHALKRLGELRPHLTSSECLWLAELGRDACDALDHGAIATVTLPSFDYRKVEPEQLPNLDEIRVAVRQVASPRPPNRPARPRNIVAAVDTT